MLHFNKIQMENFGTYKGVKELDFTHKDGVTIIWGNNGLGKTTLLNAFKYVLFNKVSGRGEEETPKRQLINWDAFSKGEYAFKVSLYFSMDDKEYILTRRFFLANRASDPTVDANYREEVQLFSEGSILSSDSCQHIINTIMPEQVSRFFLFDGELLKEYEELLHEEKSIGQKIKQSIEEILGVPILSNALSDTDSLAESYESQLAVAAQNCAEHQAQGQALERHLSRLDTLNQSMSELQDKKTKYLADLKDIEALRAKNERIKQLLDDIAHLESNKSKAESQIREKRSQISVFANDAWRSALSATIKTLLTQLTTERDSLEERRRAYEGAKKMLDSMKASLVTKRCSFCHADLASEKIDEINSMIAELEAESKPLSDQETARLDVIKNQIKLLSDVVSVDVTATIQLLENQISDLIVDVADAKQQIAEKKGDIANYSAQKEEVETIEKRYRTTCDLLANVEEGIKNLQADIDQLNEDIKRAKGRLVSGQSSDDTYLTLQKKSKFCADLRDLINDSLDTYRKYLKQQVEEDATQIFLNLSSDPSYVRLRINDNFGLNIIHESGQVVSIRSAGFEHVVALSLIGALHQNAPLQGPIVMDSPFGRLDSVHEKNIISYLPNLANQVMLFVFDKEINEQLSRMLLAGDLLQEFLLVRGSAFETHIRRK